MDEETMEKYDALEKQFNILKEKYNGLRKKQRDLADAHMKNSELYYGVKSEMIKLGRELEDLEKGMDNIKNETK